MNYKHPLVLTVLFVVSSAGAFVASANPKSTDDAVDSSINATAAKAKTLTCETAAANLEQFLQVQRKAVRDARERENAVWEQVAAPKVGGPHIPYITAKRAELAELQEKDADAIEKIFAVGDRMAADVRGCR